MGATGSADATGSAHAQEGSHPCAETGRTHATQTVIEPSITTKEGPIMSHPPTDDNHDCGPTCARAGCMNQRLLDEKFKLLGDLTTAETALLALYVWVNSYPLEVFPEPDLVRADALLKAGGMSLDVISAAAMRHVLGGVKKIVDQALMAIGGDENT